MTLCDKYCRNARRLSFSNLITGRVMFIDIEGFLRGARTLVLSAFTVHSTVLFSVLTVLTLYERGRTWCRKTLTAPPPFYFLLHFGLKCNQCTRSLQRRNCIYFAVLLPQFPLGHSSGWLLLQIVTIFLRHTIFLDTQLFFIFCMYLFYASVPSVFSRENSIVDSVFDAE